MGFLNEKELAAIGFKYLGQNVRISNKASLYNTANISIHNNVRIDDFCILSAGEEGIEIGQFVHIGCYSSLIGKSRIVLDDFSGISGRVSIYSSNDDYSGEYMAHPTIPAKFRNVQSKEVILEKHVIVGVATTILPGVRIREGAAIGAHSLVKSNCEPFMIYYGVPAIAVKRRSNKLLDMEKIFQKEQS